MEQCLVLQTFEALQWKLRLTSDFVYKTVTHLALSLGSGNNAAR